MNKIIILLFILLFFVSCLNEKYLKTNFTENDIQQFFLHKQRVVTKNGVDSSIVFVREFIVNNFHKYNDSIIVKFIQKELKKEMEYYDEISFSFYKHSKTTNFYYIDKSPKYFDLHAEGTYSATRDMRFKDVKYKANSDSFTLFQIKKNRDYGRIKRYSVK